MAGRCMGYHDVGYLRFEVFWLKKAGFGDRSSSVYDEQPSVSKRGRSK